MEARKRWAGMQSWLEDRGDDAYVVAEKFVDSTMEKTGEFVNQADNERIESQQMARTFFRMLSDKLNLEEREEPPSPEEVKEAIDQLKDVGRFSFFVSFSVLPGGAALLIALELLARRYGIDWFTFIPSSFRENVDDMKEEGKPKINEEDRKDAEL